MEELAEALAALPLHDGLRFVEERTGYRKMLEQENTPESEGRIENLDELASAAAEASERGESVTDFLDHAALVADADAVDEHAQVSLLTLHNAKGLEFPSFSSRAWKRACFRTAGPSIPKRCSKKNGGFATSA